MSSTDSEIEYLRAVEDLFCALRGLPHTLSPKDIHLARELWKEGVPTAAISAGVSEIIDRKRQTGDPEPVVSLSYCRHAIRKNAKRLAEQRVGAHSESYKDRETNLQASTRALVERLNAVADAQSGLRPLVADAVARVARELQSAEETEPGTVESLAFDLETAMLDSCWSVLEETARLEIDRAAEGAAAESGAEGDALARARRAFRDRELRKLLKLPRLEIA